MPICACGCREETAGGVFLPGHDQKLRIATEVRTGGLPALVRLVDAAEAYALGKKPLTDLAHLSEATFRR